LVRVWAKKTMKKKKAPRKNECRLEKRKKGAENEKLKWGGEKSSNGRFHFTQAWGNAEFSGIKGADGASYEKGGGGGGTNRS